MADDAVFVDHPELVVESKPDSTDDETSSGDLVEVPNIAKPFKSFL